MESPIHRASVLIDPIATRLKDGLPALAKGARMRSGRT